MLSISFRPFFFAGAILLSLLAGCSKDDPQTFCETELKKSLLNPETLEIFDFSVVKSPAAELNLAEMTNTQQQISLLVKRCRTENLPSCAKAKALDDVTSRVILFATECGKHWSCYSMRYKAETKLGLKKTTQGYCGISNDGTANVLDMDALSDALNGG